MKVHTGDTVVIITGKDKGKTGTVLRVLESKNRIVVGGINMRTRHMRRTANQPGQKVRYEASINASNVMVVDPKTKKRTRVGTKVDEKTGRKMRIAKRSGEKLTVAAKPSTTKKGSASTEAVEAKKSAKTTKKDAKTTKKDDATVVDGPENKPFWKRLGFGADAMEESAEHPEKKAPQKQSDRSIPDNAQTPNLRSSGHND